MKRSVYLFDGGAVIAILVFAFGVVFGMCNKDQIAKKQEEKTIIVNNKKITIP